MHLLVAQCRFPRSLMGYSKKKIVIKRKLSQSHCVRRHDYKAESIQLDLSSFTRILRIEPVQHEEDIPQHLRGAVARGEIAAEAEVEAMSSYETMVDALLPLGLVPAVVPEFKGITIGGSIQGLAAESSSFKYGFVHDCVTGFEALLADGRRLWCSQNENCELYQAIPGSFGSLGICTKATILLTRAQPWVEVTLRRHSSHQAAVHYMAAIQDASIASSGSSSNSGGSGTPHGHPVFLEGIGYSGDYFATIEGRYTSEPPQGTPKRHCNGFGDKWFFNQVKDALDDVAEGDSEEVRRLVYDTKSYLFRHDRGSFWMASYRIPQMVASFLLGSLLDSTNMFLLATALPWVFPKHQIVLQDFMLPRNTVSDFFDGMQEVTPLYPVWLLPMRNVPSEGSLFGAPSPFAIADTTEALYGSINGNGNGNGNGGGGGGRSMHMVNVGAYGIPKRGKSPSAYSFERDNRRLEEVLVKHGGRKVFYSHAFFDEKTFYDKLYDGETYFRLRDKYCADGALPEIIEKVVTKDGKL
jgi:FAD/FMN-containing dehydrogenase